MLLLSILPQGCNLLVRLLGPQLVFILVLQLGEGVCHHTMPSLRIQLCRASSLCIKRLHFPAPINGFWLVRRLFAGRLPLSFLSLQG